MSSLPPPDPITTGFNPEAWIADAGLSSRALQANYVTYPTAQNFPITFSNLELVTDAALTKMANTSYVYSLIQSLLSPTTWTGSNQFNSIQVDTLANITLNNANFAGTTTLTNSTFNNPLTPTYPYPIGTAVSPDTPSIGTAGTIGFIPATTFITNTVGEGSGASGFSVRSVSLTAGTWIVYGFAKMPVNTYITNYGIQFSTALNNNANEFGRKTTQGVANTFSTLVQGLTTMGTVSLTGTTTYYLNIGRSVATIDSSTIIAVRIG